MERARRPQPAPRPARAPKPEARARAASLAVVATAAIAIAACLSAAPPTSTGGADAGGAIAPAELQLGGDAAAYQGRPWLDVVLAPAYAQGDAYVITDLGNMFKLNVEQPPGINWTQVLLDRIAAAEDRSRRSVDELRDDTRGVTDDIRRAIEDYIRKNNATLTDHERRFTVISSMTNRTIADMISGDAALNASINQLVRNIHMDMTDNDAVASAISSQMHYVYYDSPALLMTCVLGTCSTDDLEPIVSIPQGTSRYFVYGDPRWTAPNVMTVNPIHSVWLDKYLHPDKVPIYHEFKDFRVYDTFYSYSMNETERNNNGRNRLYMIGHGDGGPQDAGQPLYTNAIVWGCFRNLGYCNSDTGDYMPRTSVYRPGITQLDTPVGYPYHVDMITKTTTPVIKRGADFGAVADAAHPVRYDGPSDHSKYNQIVPVSKYNDNDAAPGGWADWEFTTFYGPSRTPFDRDAFLATASHTLVVDTNELVAVGLGSNGELLKYLGGAGLPAMPASGTDRTWPDCSALPRCDKLSFAVGERVPRSGQTPAYWPVVISPQLQFTTWDSHNTLIGTYNSAVPQFIDRLNGRILTPTFQEPPPAAEAGKVYDVRGFVRIPLPTDTQRNVTHVSLRPLSSQLDLDAMGRAYMANSSNTPSNLYNIHDSEFLSIGLHNCNQHWYSKHIVWCEERRSTPGGQTWQTCHLIIGATYMSCKASYSDIGKIVAERPDFAPKNNARLPQLEGVNSDVIYIPLVQGYTGFRLVIDGVAMFIEYKDVRTDDHIFLSPPRSDRADRISAAPIHWAGANVTTTSQVVAPRSGTMSILAVVSATGSVEIMNEYHTNVRPSRPPIIDPLSVTMDITKNGVHHGTVDIGINEHPATTVNFTNQHVPLVRGGLDLVAMRSVSYDYPSFVFAGTTTVPVAAGDHVLLELTAKIEGEIDEWTPQGTMITTRGVSSADVAINAASIMMGVG